MGIFRNRDQLTLADIASSLKTLTKQGNQIMINVAALTASVAKNTTVEQSALALIQGFKDSQAALAKQLADAIATNDPVALAAVQTAIDSSVTALDSSDSDLADAVAANTPAASSPA